jgi:hypothetical protein
MKQKVVALLAAFLTVLVISCKPETKETTEEVDSSDSIIVTESMVSALNKITSEYQRRGDIITFVNSALKHKGQAFYEELAYEYHGIRYSYDVNGKYLFVTEIEYGGAGSSYQYTNTYIVDTDVPELVPIKNIFVNTSDPSFVKLVVEYLSKDQDFDKINADIADSLSTYGFNVFYATDGVGLMWDKGTISANAFSFEIVLPYSAVKDYLTPTGQDVFGGK